MVSRLFSEEPVVFWGVKEFITHIKREPRPEAAVSFRKSGHVRDMVLNCGHVRDMDDF